MRKEQTSHKNEHNTLMCFPLEPVFTRDKRRLPNFIDEPTAVLTPQEVDELIATLKNLKEQGKTIIVITHKLREVMELADSITVIKQGKVVGNVLKKDTSERELAQMMVGRDVVLTVNNARKQQVESEIMYKAENLTTVNDYGKEVVSDMSF